jgi:hypothetical protein
MAKHVIMHLILFSVVGSPQTKVIKVEKDIDLSMNTVSTFLQSVQDNIRQYMAAQSTTTTFSNQQQHLDNVATTQQQQLPTISIDPHLLNEALGSVEQTTDSHLYINSVTTEDDGLLMGKSMVQYEQSSPVHHSPPPSYDDATSTYTDYIYM